MPPPQFPVIVQLVIVGLLLSLQKMPPPDRVDASLSIISQSVMVALDETQQLIPPPLLWAVFSVILQLVISGLLPL